MTLEDNNRTVERAVRDSIPSEHLAQFLQDQKSIDRTGLSGFREGELPLDLIISSLQSGEDTYRNEAISLLESFYNREGPIMRASLKRNEAPFSLAEIDTKERGMVPLFNRYQPDPTVGEFSKAEKIESEQIEVPIEFLGKDCLRLNLIFRGRVMVFLIMVEKDSGNLWDIEEIGQESGPSDMIDFERAFSWEDFLGNIIRRQLLLPGASAESVLLREEKYWLAPFDNEGADRFVEAGGMRHSSLEKGYVADKKRTRLDIKPNFLEGFRKTRLG